MTQEPVAALLMSLAPVIVFLLALHALDTYRLLSVKRVVVAVVIGCVAAVVCYPINTKGFSIWGAGFAYLGAPVLEELTKAAYAFYCIGRHRVGFPVDAAVTGFALGAGFSLVENIVYFYQLPPSDLLVWLVRGVGTATMHGGATAIVAVVSVVLFTRWRWLAAGPALALGIGVHVLYNSGALPAMERTVVIMATLPGFLMLVFWQSERMLSNWLYSKFDDDLRTLDMIESGAFLESPAGVYLSSLRGSFKPEIVTDMFCLLRLSAEASAKSKAELVQRELGFAPPPDPERAELLREMTVLEGSIGRAGRRALAPLLPPNARDRWERTRMMQS